MIQYLPYRKFILLNQRSIDKLDVNSIRKYSSNGFILEVDLEYPDELHERHNDYPLAPEKLEINHDMLSKYSSNTTNKYDIKIDGVNKLVPHLGNKSKYVLHYKNLQLYLSLGMKLVSVHRVLKFKRSDWLKKYNDFKTDRRKNAVNSFEKEFLKLMNNRIYGKTMENLGKRLKIRLVNYDKDYKKFVRKPSIVSQKIFSKNFVTIHEIKPVVTLNKSINVKFSILDLSKLLMYEFYSKQIGTKENNSAKLLFTDTDSLVYDIETDDVYQDFYKNKYLFHFSDYPEDLKFFDLINKKVIGKMKDEFKGKIINKFVGLKSKMYSLVIVNNEEIKKAKVVNKNVIKNIRHKKYVDFLFNTYFIRNNMKGIQSRLNRIGSYDVFKIYLSFFDDKRYILDDDINSLAYFHKDVKLDKANRIDKIKKNKKIQYNQ